MNKTKKKIILSAIELFNEQGLVNVRNQDIAEKAGISLSNFNYHFGTKKDLVLAVIDHMKSVLENEVYGNDALLTKDGRGLAVAKSYFKFEQNFRFFFLDTHNILLLYPELRPALEKQIQEAIQMIKNVNYIGIGKGYLKPAPPEMPNLYDYLAHQIWINNHFWLAQMNIRGEEEGDIIEKGMRSIFAITYPYFTEIGKERFKKILAGDR